MERAGWVYMPSSPHRSGGCLKSVIIGGYRHTVESPRYHYPEAELWLQSTSARAWDWILYDWSRWFDIHTVDPQPFYPGIKAMRPDVLNWYYKQGSERPIYFTNKYRDILASRAYPIDRMTEKYGASYFGCQLDYMGAMALDEGFGRWILYGVGQPYADDRTSEAAQKWWRYHGTFVYWLRLAKSQGVEIILDTPASNMFSLELIADEEQYPTPPPLTSRYGYDMGLPPTHADELQTVGFA